MGPNQKKYCKKCKCLDCEYTDKKDKCSGKKVTGKCGNTYVGDGVCDDVNNNAGCNWDNGDCCGKKMVYKYCKACKCLDPTKQTCSQKCGSPAWTNDGICDDDNNNCGCGWDKGDCCGDSGKQDQKKYCKVCKCLDPKDADFAPKEKVCLGKCSHPNWVGDGLCDAGNNNCGCKWDKDDCCVKKSDKQFKFCTNKKLCLCLDPAKKKG